MHPIERLRHVARAEGADPTLVAGEAARALAQVASVGPIGLVPACRRLIDRHLTSAPVWWVSARVLSAPDPRRAALDAAGELDDDPTERALARALPEEATVLVIGWPDLAGSALRRRGDLEVLVAEGGDQGYALARRLADARTSVTVVGDRQVAPAAVVADLVLVEAHAAGPDGLLASPGSHAAVAVAAHAGVPVWAVAGVGRVLPDGLWAALLGRVDASGTEPWDREVERVPADLLSGVLGPEGLLDPETGLAQATCPVAPEALRDA